MNAGLFLVGHHFHPIVGRGQNALDFRHRQILFQFQGQRLAVAAHGAHAHAQAVHHHRVGAAAEDFIGFHAAFPFFFGLAVAQIGINPRNQAAGQGHAELRLRIGIAAQEIRHFAVDIQNGAGRIGQFSGHLAVHRAHAFNQFAHVFGTGARSRLISHAGGPFHQIVLKQAAQSHQHQRHGAVAADIVFHAVFQGIINHAAVNRIQHNHRIIIHAQR